MQLDILDQSRNRKDKSKVIKPLEDLSKSTVRNYQKELAMNVLNNFEKEKYKIFHEKDVPILQSMTYNIPSSHENWEVVFGDMDNMTAQKKKEAVVCAKDIGQINRKGYHLLANIIPEMPREEATSKEKQSINNKMQKNIPISVVDLDEPISQEDINENIDINDEEIITGVTKSIGKCGYRNIQKILKYIIPILVSENVLDPCHPTIHLRISGDGRKVGRKVKHVMICFSILDDKNNHYKPERYYTLILYPGIENYNILQKTLAPLINDLTILKEQGLLDEQGNNWKFEFYFSSDWKFLAICLGLNAANSENFCPWCFCSKKNISNKNYENEWVIKKDMKHLKEDFKQYKGHIHPPLFTMIPLKNWVPDELHVML